MARSSETAKRVLRRLVKFVALVTVAGGVGVALGKGLTMLSEADSVAPPTDRPGALAQVRVTVLDGRLHTDATPSGRREQRARMTVRLRVENAGGQTVTINPPTLRVGNVRVPSHPDDDAPGAQLDPLAAGQSQTVTLRFPLGGEATPKVVRDRRARILIAGRSLPMRVKVRSEP